MSLVCFFSDQIATKQQTCSTRSHPHSETEWDWNNICALFIIAQQILLSLIMSSSCHCKINVVLWEDKYLLIWVSPLYILSGKYVMMRFSVVQSLFSSFFILGMKMIAQKSMYTQSTPHSVIVIEVTLKLIWLSLKYIRPISQTGHFCVIHCVWTQLQTTKAEQDLTYFN